MKSEIRESGSERTFMSGVLVLGASTVIVKLIGLAYKIPLLSLMGADGMGYFNSAYEIFALLCGVSTTGLPIAVSMLISSANEVGDVRRARGIFKTSSALLITNGALVSALVALLAEPISRIIGNTDAYLAILAISPALLFSCVSGAIRGYFQGHRQMTPTALSQLIEALGKLIFGVALAALGVRFGLSVPVCAAFAVTGVSLGSLASACFLVLRKRMATDREERAGSEKNARSSRCLMELLRISVPITLSSALMGSTRIIDMALIMRRLQDIGVSAAEANRIYGSYTTLALPIYGLVPAFIPPITESLIPRLCAAAHTGEENEQRMAVSGAMRLTLFLGVPASMGIALYSKQIMTLLFGSQTEAIALSAPLLSALSVSVLLSCMISTANAVLQSYRRVSAPIVALFVGALVKAASAYVFIGMPDFREMGAPLSTLLFNATVLFIDLAFLYRAVPRGTRTLGSLPRTLFASLVAMAASYCVYLPLSRISGSSLVCFGSALVTALGIYLLLAFLCGIVSADDIAVLKRKNKNHNR